MKTVKAVSTCAALIGLGSSSFAASYFWDGGHTDSDFTAANNWVGNSGFPGQAAGDSATIRDGNNNPAILADDLPNALSALVLDADFANADVSLQVVEPQSNSLGAATLTSAGSDIATLFADAGFDLTSLSVTGPSRVEMSGSIVVDAGNITLANVAGTVLTVHAASGSPELQFDGLSNVGPRQLVLSAAANTTLTITQY